MRQVTVRGLRRVDGLFELFGRAQSAGQESADSASGTGLSEDACLFSAKKHVPQDNTYHATSA